MQSSIFREGMPHDMLRSMYDQGYELQPGLVDPEFAADLLVELRDNGKYPRDHDEWPRVFHDQDIVGSLYRMPRLSEYRGTLNRAITDISGFSFHHLTYLTVRECDPNGMSTRIHRNDQVAGPWLVALTVAGSGSFNVYGDDVIGHRQELSLKGDQSDPAPVASSVMNTGDAWGIYSGEWSPPHAGGMNTSQDPKVMVLLYGWGVRGHYPGRI